VPELIHAGGGLLVVDKPANVALLADRSGARCLWDELKDEYERPLLVHRLDKGTSGVLAVALEPAVQRMLTKAFADRAVRKYYVARVLGRLPEGRTLTIDLPLTPGRKSRYRVAGPRASIRRTAAGWALDPATPASQEAKLSLTRLRVISSSADVSTVLLNPSTGRTHQLRVHLAWIGHPIAGDALYGNPADPAQRRERLMLHAHRLVLPGFGTFHAPLPSLH
jgi:23S rRNA-/tRNA-specific pseudouridylate synthase